MKDSKDYLAAQHNATEQAHRLRQIIQQRGGIPVEGAIALMQTDSVLQGPKLFKMHCCGCHPHADAEGNGIPGPDEGPAAPNLYGFAFREWLTGVMDPEQFVSRNYFGGTLIQKIS